MHCHAGDYPDLLSFLSASTDGKGLRRHKGCSSSPRPCRAPSPAEMLWPTWLWSLYLLLCCKRPLFLGSPGPVPSFHSGGTEAGGVYQTLWVDTCVLPFQGPLSEGPHRTGTHTVVIGIDFEADLCNPVKRCARKERGIAVRGSGKAELICSAEMPLSIAKAAHSPPPPAAHASSIANEMNLNWGKLSSNHHPYHSQLNLSS